MKILLYGSPFDPVHQGHLNIVQFVKDQEHFDKIIFIVTKNPRWKNTMTPVSQRIEMLRLAIQDMPYVELCLFEVESESSINFSIDTVRFLKKKYPADDLFYLIGSDQVVQLHKWKDIDELSALVQWICYPRDKQKIRSINLESYHVRLVKGPFYLISSTAIRELQSLNTPLLVIQYILDHQLYFVPRLRSFYSPKRWDHVVSVAQVAYQIAKLNHLPADVAFLSSILHDVAKEYSKEEQIRQFELHFPEIKRPYFSLHQYIGAIVAKQEFNIQDPLILNAIACHTTGKANMSWLDMILYAADKIEPLRGYDSNHLIALCEQNYEIGFKKVLKENIEFHQLKKEKPMGDDMRACINQYLGAEFLE